MLWLEESKLISGVKNTTSDKFAVDEVTIDEVSYSVFSEVFLSKYVFMRRYISYDKIERVITD